jgi:DNA-3-methyladenine glycosylase II
MRVTRSASTAGPSKRRADDAADVETTVANGASNTPKRARKVKAVPATPLPAPAIQSAAIVRTGNGEDTAPSAANVDDSEQIIVRPTLAFDLDAAKRHLVAADPRFASMFASLKCKPFEEDSDLNPFRALCSSILGQQVRR